MTAPATSKAELRRRYRDERNELLPADVAELSRRIADRFFASFDVTQTKVLSTFIRISKLNEIDTSAVYFRLWRDHPNVRTVAPVVDIESDRIDSVEFSPSSELVENRWGLREPIGKVVPSEEIDLVLVPLLCFDSTGHRVGYGKGFYDRLLATVRTDCLKVGLSYFPPVEAIDDAGEHDVRLDACVMPDSVMRF